MQDFRTPTAPTDLANKAYIDAAVAAAVQQALAGMTFTPPINWYLSPQSTLGASAAVAVRGRWSATPFPVGQPGFTADALACWVGTAAAGGAGVHLMAGIYKDNGTGFPDTVSAPVAVADFTTLTAGNKVATFAAPVVLAPGLYWIITLYDYTTVPTTVPTFNVFNNQTWEIPNPSGPSIASCRAYTNGTTKTALPTAGTAFVTGLGVSGNNDCPMIQVRRSA